MRRDMTSGGLTVLAVLFLASRVAQAQSAATCAFDPAAARVTVTVNGNGSNSADLRAARSTGKILLGGVACAGATVLNTDSIQVNGGPLADDVLLSGTFAPGLTAEASGGSEIEIAFALGDGSDQVIVNLSAARNRLTFTSDGIDVGNDLDRDILTAGVEVVRVDASDGDDRIDASAYTSAPPAPNQSFIELHGGAGQDTLIGSAIVPNKLYGEEDADTIHGGDSGDLIVGGPGDDLMFGRGGRDAFYTPTSADGADDMRGGDDRDSVEYIGRANGVTVTIGDAQPDGELGEGDVVRGDVEIVYGGLGPDVLVGNDAANTLLGGRGDDELYGGGGDDVLDGAGEEDILIGDDGNDSLYGGQGADFLGGGRGADYLVGHDGHDVLHGGGGEDLLVGGDGPDEYFGDSGNDDIINADSFADSVDCGEGATDDAEADPLDTFTGCEL